MTTEQVGKWEGEFGSEYTKRNTHNNREGVDNYYLKNFGLSRTDMNQEFLGSLDKNIRILEVGTNIGLQLHILAKMGFKNLYGVEVNSDAIESGRKLNEGLPIHIIKGDAMNIPFKDNFFDLVFTSGVLIHIHPDNIIKVVREMYRCSAKFIWGFEYYTDKGYVNVDYRGNKNLLWKTDFKNLFLKTFPDLSLVKEKNYPYLTKKGLTDQMYLLEKK